jgi:hypothetical protein
LLADVPGFASAVGLLMLRRRPPEQPPNPLCYGSATSKRGLAMNRNVTIGLGTLIIIIIIVALVF